jgi:hypothetical protein
LNHFICCGWPFSTIINLFWSPRLTSTFDIRAEIPVHI